MSQEAEMAMFVPRKALLAVALTAAGLTACNYFVRRDEFDSTIAELRATDARLASQIEALAGDLEALSRKYETAFSNGGGALRIDTVAYFQTGQARLGTEAKQMLDEFAGAINANHANAMVTVEGFTDPAGPAELNQRLGQQRADAVREYLVTRAGLHPAQVQAVSYGEAENRQVIPGATGTTGRENRRVSLVIDYAGPRVDIATLKERERRRRQAQR
jgi:peptidoglycan-associated lipoprotein